MKPRILHKVFLALLLSTGGALAAMVLLVDWSLGRGFLHYVNQLESERVDDLATRLAAEYAVRDGWGWLRDDPRAWYELMRPDRDFRDAPWRRDHDDHDPQRPHRDPLRLLPRTTLFDSEHRLVAGRGAFDEVRNPEPVTVNGRTVGWLALKPLERITAVRDLRFLRQQLQAFWVIAAALLGFAALLAILLARHLTRPLGRVTAAVRQLASGDFQARVAGRGRDEIADLARDVNALARTLADNQQARRRWIADIAHELRTPLAIIQGELEALRDGVRTVDEQTLDSLHAEVLNLAKLVNDLHELSLADLGALDYQRTALDLRELLEQVADTFGPRLAQHGLYLEYDHATVPALPVSGDRRRLLQLFTNLLENALRYTDSGGRVVLAARRQKSAVTVTLDDTPPGVAEADCERLFDRLYRVDVSRSRSHGGSGLGLAICRSIVEAHEGTIGAAPSRLGGLAVTVTLPVEER